MEDALTTTAVRGTPAADGGARAEPASARAPHTLFVAVVYAADGICLVAAAASRAELVGRLADYARRRGDHVLRSDHARRLRALLARGELEGAIELYFGLVGERWDREWLVTAVVTTDDRREVAALVGAVAPPDELSEHSRSGDAS